MSEELTHSQIKVLALNRMLILARYAYYVLATPIMSDALYDKWENELKAIVAKEPELEYPGSVTTTVGSDLLKAYPMWVRRMAQEIVDRLEKGEKSDKPKTT